MSNQIQPVFTSIDEILNNQIFNEKLQSNINKQVDMRINRPSPPAGMKYVRNTYDLLNENQQLNAKFFKANIGMIWENKSNLSSKVRGFIRQICDASLRETLIEINAQNNSKEAK